MASPASHLAYLSYLLLILPLAISQTPHTVKLGSSLSTHQENNSWLSASGEFAFGFHPLPGKDLFLLAIWFEKIPERTILWSVTTDDPIQKGSKVELMPQGQLVLYDHQGKQIWSRPKSINAIASSATMLDTGNFVLVGANSSHSSFIWGSFDEPTDTILPKQTLHSPITLSSRRAETDYSNGKFRLQLKEDGNLALYTVNLLSGFSYEYDDDPSYSFLGNGSRLVFNETGNIYLEQDNGTISNLTTPNFVSTKDLYQRATLDSDGVLRQYIYPKNGSSGNWSVIRFIPSDVCIEILSYPGSGACGFNSYCKMGGDGKPRCLCPPGYSFINPNNTFEGCKQDFPPQSCSPDEITEVQIAFEIKELNHTTWRYSNFEEYSPVEEGLCKQSCLDDCFCAAALFDFENKLCAKKKLPLSNGKTYPDLAVKALIKVPKADQPNRPLLRETCPVMKDKAKLVLIGSTLLSSSVFLNLLFLAVISLALYNSYRKKQLRVHQASSLTGLSLRSFTFKEIEAATDGFKEELGRGAFGTVYKGTLASNSTTLVAVKRLEKVVNEGEREFKTEVNVIGKTHHRNLVRLLGFCNEGSHRLLVYEFMSNGSLASFLFRNPRPDWNQRLQIAIGIAKGLMYLHEECGTQIIHCDIKPQNILLDDSFVSRIADFGLAKLLKTDQTRTSTFIRGTPGYLAPEWFRNLSITVKVDVYSFGVVLLEIITCRKHIEMVSVNEDEVILKEWAYKCYREGRVDLLVDNEEEAMRDQKTLERMVMVAIWCVQEDPSLRPSMKRVVRMMQGVIEVSVPMDPAFTSFG